MPSTLALGAALRQVQSIVESRIVGDSMRPTFQPGDRIRISCGGGPHRPGDVIAILTEPPTAHRVFGSFRGRGVSYLMTRGDAAWHADVPLREEHVLGRVVARHDGVGWCPVAGEPERSLSRKLAARASGLAVRCAAAVSEDAGRRVALAGSWMAARSFRRNRHGSRGSTP
jgi:hypothetical protein